MKRTFLILTIIFTYFFANSQFYNTGQDPINTKWKEINTKNFQIIYPHKFEEKAQYLANIFNYLYDKIPNSLNHSPKKISIVIHANSAKSNGMVVWAPKRMELYPTPTQDIEITTWLKQLAIHEFRHVVQIDKLNQGFTSFLYTLLGEQAIGAIVGLHIPLWFLEGDATVTETALSNGGRGRYPKFQMEYKALIDAKKNYSFDKAIYGSYKDFVPNHYRIGYYMVANARRKYGKDIWCKALDYSAQNPIGISRLSKGLYNAGIKNYKKYNIISNLYKQTLIDLDSLWKNNKTFNTNYLTIKKTKEFTSYFNPKVYKNRIIVGKQSLSDLYSFIYIDKNGKEKKIIEPGTLSSNNFNLTNNTLIWSEYKSDKRWEHASKSIIVYYNLISKKSKLITPKNGNYFSPDISNDNSKIATIFIDKYFNQHIHILDIASGKILKSIKLKYNYSNLKWMDDKQIILVEQNEKGKSIVKLNTNTKTLTNISKKYYYNISSPTVLNNSIYFCSDFNKKNNIFSLDLNGKNLKQHTNSKFGAFFPFIINNKIYFSDYTVNGYKIAIENINNSKKITVIDKHNDFTLSKIISKQENNKIEIQNIKFKNFFSKKYSGLKRTFNIHSWGISSPNINGSTPDIGIGLSSQNILNTVTLNGGVYFNNEYNNGRYFLSLNYSKLYPKLKSTFYHTKKEFLNIQKADENVYAYLKTNYNESIWENSLEIPFNISQHNYSKKITLGVNHKLNLISNINKSITKVVGTNKQLQLNPYATSINYNEFFYWAQFYNLRNLAHRDINSKWGQIITAGYIHYPISDINYGRTIGISGKILFPGIFKNHGLSLLGGFQDKTNVESSDFLTDIRGLNLNYLHKTYQTKSDYYFSLCYPDLAIGSLAYIKKIDVDLFHDFVNTKEGNNIFNIHSMGAEITTEAHFLRLIAPINIGVRLGYETLNKSNYSKLILRINFNNL